MRWALGFVAFIASSLSQPQNPADALPQFPLASTSAWIVSGYNYLWVIAYWCGSHDAELSERASACLVSPQPAEGLGDGAIGPLFCSLSCTEVRVAVTLNPVPQPTRSLVTVLTVRRQVFNDSIASDCPEAAMYRASYWAALGEDWPLEVSGSCNALNNCSEAVASVAQSQDDCVTSAIQLAAQSSSEWQAFPSRGPSARTLHTSHHAPAQPTMVPGCPTEQRSAGAAKHGWGGHRAHMRIQCSCW